ncbi:metalloprotease [Haloglomus irregulare]|jgi:membrane-associated protease RseP (regulator of RpoE activity)|uniref:Metalloprotease n=1 Tax=Haloglomus irregulare TaxID=2234134 RepID=A0A554NDT4_9EURY|nr:site-2 protease family protein [Haloglomus irregulare]TSD15170.1 metalloprotease [Haloglomus irregulare]
MVSTLWLVGGGVLLYTFVAMALNSQGRLPDAVRVQGPITTIHTQRGKAFLNWLSEPRRFWRAWGNLGVGIALVVMIGSFGLVAFAALQAVQNPQPSPLNEPQNVLAIPGVNDFLPLSVAPEIIAGLVIGLVVHEGGHGLLCRVEDIDIESMGLALLAFIPIGAFVEPDESSRNDASRGGQTRMFAAGVTNNFAIAVLCFLLLFGPVAGAIGVAAGVPVGGSLPGSPARQAGLEEGAVIASVDGQSVADADEMQAVLANSSTEQVTVGLRDGSQLEVTREVLVTTAVRSAPVEVNETITAVNGSEISTASGFERAVASRPVADLTVRGADGTRTETVPIGTYSLVAEDGALASGTELSGGETMIVTDIGGERTVDFDDLSAVLDGREPGDTVTVTGYVGGFDGDRRTYEIELGGSGSDAVLGVRVQRGVSGLVVDDFGVDVYPAGTFLTILGGDGGGDLGGIQRAYLALVLPFASLTLPEVGYNFAGFVGPVTEFYTVSGPLGLLGAGGTFLLANLLFWTAWINLIIGQFNCVPAYPLDGGHILRTTTESVVSRLPVTDGRALTSAVTTTVSVVMILGLLVMVFGPRLLG